MKLRGTVVLEFPLPPPGDLDGGAADVAELAEFFHAAMEERFNDRKSCRVVSTSLEKVE